MNDLSVGKTGEPDKALTRETARSDDDEVIFVQSFKLRSAKRGINDGVAGKNQSFAALEENGAYGGIDLNNYQQFSSHREKTNPFHGIPEDGGALGGQHVQCAIDGTGLNAIREMPESCACYGYQQFADRAVTNPFITMSQGDSIADGILLDPYRQLVDDGVETNPFLIVPEDNCAAGLHYEQPTSVPEGDTFANHQQNWSEQDTEAFASIQEVQEMNEMIPDEIFEQYMLILNTNENYD